MAPSRGELSPPTVTPDMPRRGWRAQAACAGTNDPAFTDPSSVPSLPPIAMQLCGSCPVRGDCLMDMAQWEASFANHGSLGGVWGGMYGAQRGRWYRANPDLLPPKLTTADFLPDPREEIDGTYQTVHVPAQREAKRAA